MKRYIHGRSEKVYTIEDPNRGSFVTIKSTEGKVTTSMQLHRDKLPRFTRDLDEFGYVEVSID